MIVLLFFIGYNLYVRMYLFVHIMYKKELINTGDLLNHILRTLVPVRENVDVLKVVLNCNYVPIMY